MPDDIAVFVKEEDTAHIPRRDEVVVAVFGDGVEMRVRVGIRCIDALPVARDLVIGHWNLGQVVLCAPVEDDFVGLDVDLVEEAVQEPSVFRAAYGSQVRAGGVDGSDEDGVLVCDLAFVDVDVRGHVAVGSLEIACLLRESDLVDLVVRAVQDSDLAEAHAHVGVVALPVGDHRLAV